MSRKALGKGLDALIPSSREGVREVKLESLVPSPFQMREDFSPENLQELADSIREKGVLEPILVRPRGDKFEIIAGERRVRAAKLAGMEKVPVLVKEVGDREAMEIALIENLQREELTPLERARGYEMLIKKFNFTHEEIARRLGKSRASVTNTLRLLRLPEEIKRDLQEGRITEGHARVLLTLPSREREELWKRIRLRNLSVRDTERIARKRRRRKLRITPPFLEELQRILGTRVYLEQGRKKGRMVIEYYSPQDLKRILDRLGVDID